MKTDIAIPEEPEDRCKQCGAPFQFHMDNPSGVRYIDPADVQPVVLSFEEEHEAPWVIEHKVRTCYVYKLGLI